MESTPARTCTVPRQDALRRAMEDNPELSKEFEGKLQQKVSKKLKRICTGSPTGRGPFGASSGTG